MVLLAVSTATKAALIGAGAGLLGVIIGGAITLWVTVLQSRQAATERTVAATAARRNRAAEILGRVRTFLTDIDPNRIALNVSAERTPEELRMLKARLDTLRDELSIFAAGSDDDRVMKKAGELEASLSNTFQAVGWLVHDLLSHQGTEDSYKTPRWAHRRAQVLAQIVLDLARGRDISELERQLREIDEAEPEVGAFSGGS